MSVHERQNPSNKGYSERQENRGYPLRKLASWVGTGPKTSEVSKTSEVCRDSMGDRAVRFVKPRTRSLARLHSRTTKGFGDASYIASSFHKLLLTQHRANVHGCRSRRVMGYRRQLRSIEDKAPCQQTAGGPCVSWHSDRVVSPQRETTRHLRQVFIATKGLTSNGVAWGSCETTDFPLVP